MKMQKVSLLAILGLGGLLVCTNVASAQDSNASPRRGQGQNMEQRLERLSTELKLTDEQKPKIKAILEESRKKMQELRGDSNLSDEQRREKLQTLRTEERNKMKAVLTPEQFEKLQNMRPGRRQGAPGAPAGSGADQKPDSKKSK